ncbi:hypothetical protein GLOIN_2v1472692 [Rhizophagus clarus]|uniref:Endonuclease/exonuclease/phosphatase domain-containing protein n=1 Tax=Rhizophagus clarus TaxID=94130 RepID=A0A8H3L8V0_9GLOM|nr:hypothetical protein GLOIN_2v1472692 [Rhizophagus clarus]
MDKIQDIQNTLESINRIDQMQNTILQMVKEIKNQQSTNKRNSRSSSPRFSQNHPRRKSADEFNLNTPKPRSRQYQTSPLTSHNSHEQQPDFNSDYQEYQAQQSETSSQQEYFPPHNEEMDDIDIHTVIANSETTDQPTFNIFNLIPTNWDLLILNNINDLLPDHYPSYSTNNNNHYTTDYLKIGSLNIQRGFQTKLNFITDFFITHNFAILGLTEIGITQPHLFPLKQLIPIYNPALNNDPSHPSGYLTLIKDTNGDPFNDPSSGVVILLTERLTKHLGKIRTYKGRCIEIELHFKNLHLLIINTYIHANNQKKEQILDIYNHINQSINKHKTLPHSHIIIMGGFNANPKGTPSYTPSWKKEIFRSFKKHHLINTIKFFHDNLLPTRVNREGPIPTSAIDHIYTSQHIIENTFFSDVHTINPNLEFTTDHKAPFIIIDVNLFFFHKTLKTQNNLITHRPSQWKKLKYNYNQMDEEKWKIYTKRSSSHLNKNIHQWLPDAYSEIRPSKYRVNKKWKIIKYSIKATNYDNIVPLKPYK